MPKLHAADAIVRIAILAHELWCDSMEQQGWAYAPAFDAASRRHDALVPFERLDPRDRRQALLGAEALDLLPTLVESIWYERGPARLFCAGEMREGLGVGWNTEHCEPGPDAPPEPGRVVCWNTDSRGLLCSITVAWADGTHSEHDPEARELRRLDDPPGPRAPGPAA